MADRQSAEPATTATCKMTMSSRIAAAAKIARRTDRNRREPDSETTLTEQLPNPVPFYNGTLWLTRC